MPPDIFNQEKSMETNFQIIGQLTDELSSALQKSI